MEGFQNFVVNFADMIGKEIGGYYLSQSGTPDDVSHIYMGRYVNNTATTSYKGRAREINMMTLNGAMRVHTDWHTHPANVRDDMRLQPSGRYDGGGDIGAKNNALKNLNPNQRPLYFMILTQGYAPIYY